MYDLILSMDLSFDTNILNRLIILINTQYHGKNSTSQKAISHRLLGIWMIVIMLLTAETGAAQTFLKDGLYYKVNTLNPNEVAITGVGVAFNTYALDISTINNNNVTYLLTTIGKNALLRNHFVKSVTFPKVTSIEEGAFNGCDILTSENIPNITSIPKNAFSNCVKLTGADFPNATSIGESAFSKCGKLTSLNFPIATSVGIDAFNSCVSLKSVTFPKAETIKMRAFYLCHSLTSLDFPIAESIGEDAFNTCDSLRSLDFQKAKTIGNAAFRGCKNLTSLNFPIANAIEDYAFAECSSLSSVDFPNAETIGDEAFMSCDTLVSATFPKVTFIGSFAFSYCNNFSSLRLGATPPSVDAEPFSNCPTPRNLTIVDANGIPLAGAALKAAVNAYKADAGYDTATKLWGGWTLPEIANSDLADANIYFSDTSYEADGSQQKPGVTVVLEGKTLAEGTDYTVSYGENVNPGKGTVTITGVGEYTGTKIVTFTIEPKKYTVILPSVKNATTNLAAGSYRTQEYSDFVFTVTPDKGFMVKVTTDQGETLYPYDGNHYMIVGLKCDVQVYINVLKSTAAEGIEAFSVWSKGGNIFIASPEAVSVYVVNVIGHVAKAQQIPAGTTVFGGFPAGVYILRVGAAVTKVVVR